MKVAIRTDASYSLGTGHVMRCLTLAEMLAARGANVTFICRELAGHLCEHIEQSGFRVVRIAPSPASKNDAEPSWKHDADASLRALSHLELRPDLLVVDQYSLERRWERALRSVATRILAFDDLANRTHDCDILIDPNLHDSPESRYAALVGEATRVFVGPQYALLRPEFDGYPPRVRDQGVGKLLAFFGGSDPTHEAFKVVQALRALDSRAPPTALVLGPINPCAQQVHEAARGLTEIKLLESTDKMARIMAESDLALGTCGGAAWERCLLGLPALVVISAENQRDDARILHSLGAVRNLGEGAQVGFDTWMAAITDLQEDSRALSAMSKAAMAVMVGRQAAIQEFESALIH